MLTAVHQLRCERAVETVAEWKNGSLCIQPQEWELLHDLGYDLLVFFGFDAARAVDEGAARLQKRSEPPDEGQLLVRHPYEVARPQPPARVDSAP